MWLLALHPGIAHARGAGTVTRRERPPAADTVVVGLDALERRAMERDLQILAARLNISAARATAEQARLLPNPNVSLEQGAFNRANGALFDATRTGNTEIQVQQLVQLAGKRNRNIQLATAGGRVAERMLDELLRSLRYELRTDYHDLRFLQRAAAFDDRAIAAARRTIDAAERLYTSRSILLSEVVRLRALLLNLEAERLGFRNRISDIQGSLRVLLRDEGTERWYVAADTSTGSTTRVDSLAVETLVVQAISQRADVRLAEATSRVDEANVGLQRALAIPDVSLGARYARSGSYIPDYFALTVSADLPLFNRNQGSIKAAEFVLAADRRLFEAARGRADREVRAAWHKAVDADAAWQGTDKRFADEYERLVAGTTANYTARNISIMQFTDFFDSWRQTMQQLTQLEQTRAEAIEALNYAVGAVVVQP